MCRRLASILACLLLAGLLALSAGGREGRAEILRISGIEAEQHADSGVRARETAFAEVRRTAIARAFARLGVAPRQLSAEERQQAIVYLEPRDEKVAARYYRATFSVGVESDVLLGRMPAMTIDPDREADMPDWVLVVPVHRDDDGIAVWRRDDVWSRMWLRPVMGAGTTFITAVADDEDAVTLTPARLARDGARVLAELADKYGAPAVVLAVLDRSNTGSGSHGGRLQAVFWSPSTGRRDFQYEISSVRGRDAALREAAAAVRTGVRNVWSDSRRAGKTVVKVRMPVASGPQWRQYAARMEQIPGLEVETKRLQEREVRAELIFAGPRARLIDALARRGFIGNQNSQQGE